MKEEILKTTISREKNKLYFVATDKQTNFLTLWKTDLQRGGKPGQKRPRKKNEEEILILRKANKKRWRAERKNK